MSKKENDLFEDIYEQNKKRIHYQIHKLGIQDTHHEFYTEGIYAMWNAHKKYEPTKGPMGTYFNYHIRYRLLDMLRRKTTELNKADRITQLKQSEIDHGHKHTTSKQPLVHKTEITPSDTTFWTFIRSRLTHNQWKWVDNYIIQGMSQKEIAEKECVTIEAVKSWAKGARNRLRLEESSLKDMMKK